MADMLKKISVHDIQLGMFVQKLEGSWIDHPFWRSAFLLEDPKDLQALRASAITAVWIDVSKGGDVVVEVAATVAAAETLPPAAQALAVAPAEEPSLPSDDEPGDRAADQAGCTRKLAPTSMKDEIVQARQIIKNSREAVISLFQDVRLGKAVAVTDTMPIVEEIASSVMRNPGALISIVRLKNKDDYTYLHSVAVCALMVALGRQLGLEEARWRALALAGLMHDIGKALMPLDILNKPGRLTRDEFDVIKSHPEQGWRLLKEASDADVVTLDVALHHHEKYDGTGYPHGLKGDAISVPARMGAICDVYDAITSNRPYKTGWDPAYSVRQMKSWEGQFDPRVLNAFIKSIGIYPVGSLVRLATGRLAVVTEQGEGSLLQPKIKVFFSTRSGEPIKPFVMDLASPTVSDRIVSIEDRETWKFSYLDALWSEE